MNEALAARLLPAALSAAGWPSDTTPELVRRVNPFSGVWRLRQPGGGTAIYKEAWHPLDGEAIALRFAGSYGLPVPQVLAAVDGDGRAGIIMTDLGQPDREATVQDAATVAAALHSVTAVGPLPVTSPVELSVMPARIAARARDRGLPTDVPELANLLEAAVGPLAAAAVVPPVGLCHSEFHPTSVIINDGRWHTYDLARAFHGPGLIDLASWLGTTGAPDIEGTAELIEAYVRAGGHASALERRAGLPPENWALGWHRIWAADWYSLQLQLGWVTEDGSRAVYGDVIARHLREAVTLLGA